MHTAETTTTYNANNVNEYDSNNCAYTNCNDHRDMCCDYSDHVPVCQSPHDHLLVGQPVSAVAAPGAIHMPSVTNP